MERGGEEQHRGAWQLIVRHWSDVRLQHLCDKRRVARRAVGEPLWLAAVALAELEWKLMKVLRQACPLVTCVGCVIDSSTGDLGSEELPELRA